MVTTEQINVFLEGEKDVNTGGQSTPEEMQFADNLAKAPNFKRLLSNAYMLTVTGGPTFLGASLSFAMWLGYALARQEKDIEQLNRMMA